MSLGINRYGEWPNDVEAVQVSGDNCMDVYHWIEENTGGSFEPMAYINGDLDIDSGISIDPADGRMIVVVNGMADWVNLGDYIVWDHGIFFVYDPESFADMYAEY